MTAEKASKGTSVLASLTASVMEDKVKAGARQLTPVEGEGRPKVRVPDVPGDFLTDEGLAMTARDLRRAAEELERTTAHQVAQMRKVADGIDKMRGVEEGEPEQPVDLDAARKQKEFEADLRAKEKAAQEATFKAPEDDTEDENPPEAEAPADVPDDWKCPTHGKSIVKTSPKTGREFIGCPDCNLFKR